VQSPPYTFIFSNAPLRIPSPKALRKPRTDWAVLTAAANGKRLHLGHGADRAARDAAFRATDAQGGVSPDKAIDKETQTVLYGFDCVKDAEERFERLFAGLE